MIQEERNALPAGGLNGIPGKMLLHIRNRNLDNDSNHKVFFLSKKSEAGYSYTDLASQQCYQVRSFFLPSLVVLHLRHVTLLSNSTATAPSISTTFKTKKQEVSRTAKKREKPLMRSSLFTSLSKAFPQTPPLEMSSSSLAKTRS